MTHLYHHHHHHHHLWHDSPFLAKAFLWSFRQLTLSFAAFHQFLSPNFLASSLTPSFHLNFGLALCLLPSTTATKTLLAGFCSSSRITCPAHLKRLSLMYVTMLHSLYIVYSSLLYFILHFRVWAQNWLSVFSVQKLLKYLHQIFIRPRFQNRMPALAWSFLFNVTSDSFIYPIYFWLPHCLMLCGVDKLHSWIDRCLFYFSVMLTFLVNYLLIISSNKSNQYLVGYLINQSLTKHSSSYGLRPSS